VGGHSSGGVILHRSNMKSSKTRDAQPAYATPIYGPGGLAVFPATCRSYKEALIYSIDVETYRDSNGDGIGDFAGLAESCRYLSSLGINTLWLLRLPMLVNEPDGLLVPCITSRRRSSG
jgi:hypothetical protein